jgi:uncharacterized protein
MLSICYVARAAASIPEPTKFKYVNDYVGVVDDNTRNYIVSLGNELENKTGAQETIVVINSLDGNDINSYANELFRTWGIGQKGKDNGLLILISINDKKWRVEVGRELEGTITDIYSARVMDNIAQTFFKEGNYGEGLKSAYTTFAEDIANGYNTTLELPKSNSDVSQKQNQRVIRVNPIVGYFIIALFALDILLNRARVTRFLLYAIFWNSFWDGRGPRGGGFGGFGGGSSGGNGGFGGGNSGGGGSSGGW